MKIYMENLYLNNKYTIGLVKKQLKSNPKKSIARLFTKLRGYQRLSYYGDFQILFLIISVFAQLKMKPDRAKLLYAYNKSSELRQNTKEQKQADINHFLNLVKPVKKTKPKRQNWRDKTKVNRLYR